MILTGKAIHKAVLRGEIEISPFAPDQVNPNSYNYRLGRFILERTWAKEQDPDEYTWKELDLAGGSPVLLPGRVYLGHTFERIGSSEYVTLLSGRSSLGRLGVFLNYSADLGHVGAAHCWTLELKVCQSIRLHQGMQIGQATFWAVQGRKTPYANGYDAYDLPQPAISGVRRP